jgi:hypothetical protein
VVFAWLLCYNKLIDSKEHSMKYIVQMNMADRGQEPQWTDCEDAKFVTQEQALGRIEWMKGEYGDQIEYRVRVEQ